jgi:hypothetical protein
MFMAFHSGGRRRQTLIAVALSLLIIGLGMAVMFEGV